MHAVLQHTPSTQLVLVHCEPCEQTLPSPRRGAASWASDFAASWASAPDASWAASPACAPSKPESADAVESGVVATSVAGGASWLVPTSAVVLASFPFDASARLAASSFLPASNGAVPSPRPPSWPVVFELLHATTSARALMTTAVTLRVDRRCSLRMFLNRLLSPLERETRTTRESRGTCIRVARASSKPLRLGYSGAVLRDRARKGLRCPRALRRARLEIRSDDALG